MPVTKPPVCPQIYATLWSFYIPLTVMIVVYYKIFRAARRIVLEERRAQTHLGPPHTYLQPPPALPAACCNYHNNNTTTPTVVAPPAAAGGGGGGGGGAVKNGGTSPDAVLANLVASGASLLVTTPTGTANPVGGNVSPGSSPAASTPAASGRQHRASTTSTNTTVSSNLGRIWNPNWGTENSGRTGAAAGGAQAAQPTGPGGAQLGQHSSAGPLLLAGAPLGAHAANRILALCRSQCKMRFEGAAGRASVCFGPAGLERGGVTGHLAPGRGPRYGLAMASLWPPRAQ